MYPNEKYSRPCISTSEVHPTYDELQKRVASLEQALKEIADWQQLKGNPIGDFSYAGWVARTALNGRTR